MTDNTSQTARNLGLLGLTQIINDLVGASDPDDFFKFSLNGTGDFDFDINGGLYGLEISKDRNRNGQIDAGEKLITIDINGNASVFSNLGGSISNTSNNGVVVARRISLNGSLDTGDYFIRVFSPTGNNSYTMSLEASNITGGIQGTKWNDLNNNGLQDTGELGLAGGTIYLDTNNNGQRDLGEASTTTDLNGNYSFTNLAPGNYTVRELLPNDRIQSAPASGFYNVSVTSGNTTTGIDFGSYQANSIFGTRWHDLNGDGLQDAGEPGLAGGTIYLDTNNNGQLDAGETSTTTDTNGDYAFTNLASGNYTVRDVLPNGWMRSTPPSGFHNISLTSGNTVTGQNFGSFQTATINGSKWNDLNGDGIWDAGEPGLAGWTIYLDQNQNGQLDAGETPTITDVNGNYTFTGLSPGTYTVAEVLQPGWEQTFPGSGGMPTPQFQIDLNFLDSNLTPSQQAIFTQASQRWSEIITADLPDIMTANLGLIDDLFIEVSTPAIDGVGNTLGQAGPTLLRSGSFLPYTGTMEFDIADLANLEANGRLEDVILHEMGHVLGIGTIWDNLNLLSGNNTADPQFLGAMATAEYNSIFNLNASSVPVEAGGGPGTAYAHWRESIFDNELMTGFLESSVDNPLSRITIASLADLGYQVDLTAADPYFPPTAPNLVFSSQKSAGKFIALDKDATVVDPVSIVNFANNTSLGVHTVNLTSGETATGLNFGNQFLNQSPIAVNDTAITDEDTSINIAILANDSDPDVGDVLTISNLDSSNTQGTVILNPNNTISYDPTAAYQALDTGESAIDSFTYTISDGNGATDTATVTVTINGSNDAPILSPVNKIGDEDTIINFSAADFVDAFNDPEGNSLSEIQIVSLPDRGILSVNGSPINAGDVIAIADLNNLTFAPSANFNGTTSFAWNASDGSLAGIGAAVNITVNAVNDLPIALDDSATTAQDQSATIDVLANDRDPVEGDPLSIATFDATSTSGGAIALDNNSTPNDLTDDRLIYTPATGYIGTDSFSYTISDGNGGSATATVNITVNPADPLVLIGTPGNDTLVADSGDDVLFSLGGNDIVQGQAGDDVAYGGPGNDSLLGDEGQDILLGEQDRDFLQGGNGGDFLNGGAGDDLLFGDGGGDTLIGGIGNDFLQGGDGSDWLEGGVGIDLLFGGSGNDGFLLRSGEGIDLVFDFSDGNDLFLLADGLTFSQLNIISSGNSTLISENSSGEQLAYVFAVSSVLISETDFVSV